jgi:pyruvate/2-oxoglutarate dehydrogenase complex dihydrolipoamide acyltransferase (E2) component
MITKKHSHLLAIILILGILLVACQPEEVTVEVPVEVTRVVTETITEEGETVEVTRVVTEEVIVEVPAEEEEAEEVMMTDPTPMLSWSSAMSIHWTRASTMIRPAPTCYGT